MEQARQVRVFVSSTHPDMVEDRNELSDHSWPQLRVLCQSLGVDFVVVDLRWGINEEQSRRNEVLSLCLDEVRKCPYFIGLLGERYGEGLGPAAYTQDLCAKEQWIDAYRDRSVTELEILCAALNVPSAESRSHFFFRDPDYARQRGGKFVSRSPGGSTHQRNLKERIEATCEKQHLTLRKGYTTTRQLADWVFQDLAAAIREDFPTVDSSPSEQEAFAATRRRVYIHSAANYEQLDSYARSAGGALVVTGEAGVGKTALLANWSPPWRAAYPDDFVFEHYTVSSPDSASHWNLMRRLVQESKTWSNDDSPLPDSRDRLLGEFELWLRKLRAEAERRKVRAVVILDGLAQLDAHEHATLLGWLPESPWGGSLRLVVSAPTSASERHPLEALKARGWQWLNLNPLAPCERRELIVEYLQRFRKELLPEQLDLVAGIEAGANPLFLKVLLDELIVTGQYGEAMRPLLSGYAKATTVAELLDKVLRRWETAYERDRPQLVGEALALLWSARRGLSEEEVLRLLATGGQVALPFAVWSPLRSALWEAMANHRGILSFNHEYLRKAVEQRFLNDASVKEQYRRRLADEFDSDRPTSRCCEEFPWLLARTNQTERLRRFLLERTPFLIMS